MQPMEKVQLRWIRSTFSKKTLRKELEICNENPGEFWNNNMIMIYIFLVEKYFFAKVDAYKVNLIMNEYT